MDRNTKLHTNRSCNVENEASLRTHDLLFVLHFLHSTQTRLNIPAKFTIFVFAIILLTSQCCKCIFVSGCLVYLLFGWCRLQVYGFYKKITSFIYLSSLNQHSMHATFQTPNHIVWLILRRVSALVGAIFRYGRLNCYNFFSMSNGCKHLSDHVHWNCSLLSSYTVSKTSWCPLRRLNV